MSFLSAILVVIIILSSRFATGATVADGGGVSSVGETTIASSTVVESSTTADGSEKGFGAQQSTAQKDDSLTTTVTTSPAVISSVDSMTSASAAAEGEDVEPIAAEVLDAAATAGAATDPRVNWTLVAKWAKKPTRRYLHPHRKDPVACRCDLTRGLCDFRCCCDQDCRAEDKRQFSCQTGTGPTSTQSSPAAACSSSTRSPSSLDADEFRSSAATTSARVPSPFLCVESQSSSYLGDYWPDLAPVSDGAELDALLDSHDVAAVAVTAAAGQPGRAGATTRNVGDANSTSEWMSRRYAVRGAVSLADFARKFHEIGNGVFARNTSFNSSAALTLSATGGDLTCSKTLEEKALFGFNVTMACIMQISAVEFQNCTALKIHLKRTLLKLAVNGALEYDEAAVRTTTTTTTTTTSTTTPTPTQPPSTSTAPQTSSESQPATPTRAESVSETADVGSGGGVETTTVTMTTEASTSGSTSTKRSADSGKETSTRKPPRNRSRKPKSRRPSTPSGKDAGAGISASPSPTSTTTSTSTASPSTPEGREDPAAGDETRSTVKEAGSGAGNNNDQHQPQRRRTKRDTDDDVYEITPRQRRRRDDNAATMTAAAVAAAGAAGDDEGEDPKCEILPSGILVDVTAARVVAAGVGDNQLQYSPRYTITRVEARYQTSKRFASIPSAAAAGNNPPGTGDGAADDGLPWDVFVLHRYSLVPAGRHPATSSGTAADDVAVAVDDGGAGGRPGDGGLVPQQQEQPGTTNKGGIDGRVTDDPTVGAAVREPRRWAETKWFWRDWFVPFSDTFKGGDAVLSRGLLLLALACIPLILFLPNWAPA